MVGSAFYFNAIVKYIFFLSSFRGNSPSQHKMLSMGLVLKTVVFVSFESYVRNSITITAESIFLALLHSFFVVTTRVLTAIILRSSAIAGPIVLTEGRI